jgi:hypothetical protein
MLRVCPPSSCFWKEAVTVRVEKKLGLLAIAMAMLLTPDAHATHAIAVGQLDDFQDGTDQNWGCKQTPPLPDKCTVTNISTGGPDGVGDRYLEVVPIPPPAGPGRLGANNKCQWGSGASYCSPPVGPNDLADYVTNNIVAIAVDLYNWGPNVVHMGLLLTGNFDTCGRWTTANPVVLNVDSGWQHVVFNLSEPHLIEVQLPDPPPPTTNLIGCLRRMKRIVIHHEPDPANWSINTTPQVNATLGIDNVEAIPEPSHAVLLGAALLGLLALARRGPF